MSDSQIGQDLWVLEKLQNKRNGYFVEFGAGNGILNSNTHLLQKKYNWSGLLAEPCKSVQEELFKNRSTTFEDRTQQRVAISTAAVAPTSGHVTFREAPITELSTMQGYGNDHLAGARVGSTEYSVPCYTLQKLLAIYDAPYIIDYLSIDTEGSEFDILQAFDFTAYDIKLITVEHNFTSSRQPLRDLLLSKGFTLDKEVEWDDWYVAN